MLVVQGVGKGPLSVKTLWWSSSLRYGIRPQDKGEKQENGKDLFIWFFPCGCPTVFALLLL